MSTDELIRKCKALLDSATACKEHVTEAASRRELVELRRVLTRELREPKPK